MNKNNTLKAIAHVILALWPTAIFAETTVICASNAPPEETKITSTDAISSSCGTYLDEAGEEATFCQWQFAYRTQAARAAFLDAETALDGCYKKAERIASDVNHPDSYDQVLYTADTQAISLSLKDKAQHQSTYLFLRIETAP